MYATCKLTFNTLCIHYIFQNTPKGMRLCLIRVWRWEGEGETHVGGGWMSEGGRSGVLRGGKEGC